VEACLTLCDQLKPGLSIFIVRDKASENRGLSHLTLLKAFPTVRVAQDEYNAVFNRFPEVSTARMRGLDVSSCALVQISQEVGESLNRRDIGRKWKNVLIGYMRLGQAFRSKVQLEPWKWTMSGVVKKREKDDKTIPL
jgi:hypothetical protein